MSMSFPLDAENGRTAIAVHVSHPGEVPTALRALGLRTPRPVVVLVGGAGGLDSVDADGLRPLFEDGLVPVVAQLGAVAIDGGTWSGVIRLSGEARASAGASFPLVGVAAAGTVALPGDRARSGNVARLDPYHTHFVLVPGEHWGDEAPWIALVASSLAGSAPSVTVVVNGGEIVYSDVKRSVEAGRSVLTVEGSGRTADQLAAAVRGSSADERAVTLAESGLVRAVPAGIPEVLAAAVAAALGRPGRR